jgi:hypothetical protein
MREIAHPLTDIVTGQMIGRAKEIRSVLTELRISKCQKLVEAVSDPNAICKRSIDTSKEFVILFLVST